ncbi:MAG: single-stranded DNA-binding protein, partial [bacterium]|nr:single-stranded DNA-binding protein [bacterium]
RLTRDPEIRYTQSGTGVANFSIATNRTYVQGGEKKELASFFNCVAWSKLGELIVQYCKKGQRIGVEGRLQQRSWEDQQGNKRSTVEIVVENVQFLSPKGEGTGMHTDMPSQATDIPNGPEMVDNPFSDDDIPF